MATANGTPAGVDAQRRHPDESGAFGLYAWIYRGADWYITDPHAPHAERESRTVQFPPTIVPTNDDVLDGAVEGFAKAIETFVLPHVVAAPAPVAAE